MERAMLRTMVDLLVPGGPSSRMCLRLRMAAKISRTSCVRPTTSRCTCFEDREGGGGPRAFGGTAGRSAVGRHAGGETCCLFRSV